MEGLFATLCACLERWIGIHGAMKSDSATKKEARIPLNPSIAQMLAQLEAKVALPRERKGFHAERTPEHDRGDSFACYPWPSITGIWRKD